MEKNITLGELIDDINKSSVDEYIFIRILNNNKDRELFLSNLFAKDYTEIIMTKKIKLSLWVYIMNLIQTRLSVDYILYRKTYIGENTGKKLINTQLTNRVVPMWCFETKREKVTNVQQIIRYCMSNNNIPINRIILCDNKMESFEFKTSKYILASWQNCDYKLKNILV